MSGKQAVHFSPRLVTAHRYERLRYCRTCGSVTSLRGETCPSCRRTGTLLPLSRMGAGRIRLRRLAEAVVLVLAAVAAVAFAANPLERTVVAVLGAGALSVYFYLLRRYADSFAPYRLHRLLLDETDRIAEGLATDERAAEADYEADRYRECYEKLREIGEFIWTDRIRYNKVICLDRFVLRKDMDLELESVVPQRFNKLFVRYLWEVSKVNRPLIRERTLDYALRFRGDIEKLPYGPEVMTNIASAALRSQANLGACEYLLADYAVALPRDRFLRLCRLLASTRGYYPTLAARTAEIARTRYAGDKEVERAAGAIGQASWR